MEVNTIVNALKSEVASNIFQIYIPSLKKKFPFRPITLGEQKTISKILIGNSSNNDTYKTLLALIKEVSLDEEFDVFSLTEPDRIKVLIEFYSQNYFSSEFPFTCTKCKHSFDKDLSLRPLGDKLDDLDFSVRHFTYITHDKIYQLDFDLSYPNVRKIAEFNDSGLGKLNDNSGKHEEIDELIYNQEEKFKLLINTMKLVKLSPSDEGDTKFDINFNEYSVKDQFSILESLQSEIFIASNGLLQFAVKSFFEPLSNITLDIVCPKCGATIPKAFDIQSFFLF